MYFLHFTDKRPFFVTGPSISTINRPQRRMEMMSPSFIRCETESVSLWLTETKPACTICAAFSLPVPAKKATKQSKRSEATTPPIG